MPNKTNAAPRRAWNLLTLLSLVTLFLCSTVRAQNTINIIPNASGTSVGAVNFYDISQTFSLSLQAPNAMGSNYTLMARHQQ
jgi:hypothetical protein